MNKANELILDIKAVRFELQQAEAKRRDVLILLKRYNKKILDKRATIQTLVTMLERESQK